MAQPNISGYHIERLLGRGGFATVYLATNSETQHPTAIKVLLEHATSDDDVKRFERERLSMTALTGHPHIVGVFESGQTDDGQHFMALEYVEGGAVRDLLVQSGAMHWADVLPIGVGICSALDVAHRNGVLHRDIKPANILLSESGAKLGDFGIARLIGQSNLTAAQSIIGTLAYTPPEIFHNDAFDGRGDIYQLGITLYEMLLGRAPFTSAAADNKGMVIRRILEHPAPPLAQFDIPVPLSDLLDEVLAKDPTDRPQSAAEFGRRLNDVEVRLGRPVTPLVLAEPVGAPEELTAQTSEAGSAIHDADIGDILAGSTVTQHVRDTPPASSTRATIFSDTPEPDPDGPGPAQSSAKQRSIDPTVVERPASDRTSVLAPSRTRAPEQPAPRRRNSRGLVLIGVLTLLTALGATGFLFWQSRDNNADDIVVGPTTTSTVAPTSTTGLIDDDPIGLPIARVDQPAFSEAVGSDGLIFAAVANSQGLTAVGATGSGERVSEQSSAVWTMGSTGTWDLRADFAAADGLSNEAQRLWDIGVIDGVQFLAVGDGGTSGTDGVAWVGLRAATMRPVTDDSFIGVGDQTLRGVVGDSAGEQFIVVGQRHGANTDVPGLWTVTEGESWADPVWTVVPIGDGSAGILADVALGELEVDNVPVANVAVAVGWESANGRDQGMVLIRRESVWVPLLEPIADARFEGVTIADGRIFAVGYRTIDGMTLPIAVVTDVGGNGFVHNLPVSDVSGRAHGILATSAGAVLAVGEIGEQSGDTAFGDFTDGAIWELIEGETLGEDRWTTRETDSLRVDGLQEFWSITEFGGTIYTLGKADAVDPTDDRRTPAAWVVDLPPPT